MKRPSPAKSSRLWFWCLLGAVVLSDAFVEYLRSRETREPSSYLAAVAPHPLVNEGPKWVMWCVDDDGWIVPLRPDLISRGRVTWLEFGQVPPPPVRGRVWVGGF